MLYQLSYSGETCLNRVCNYPTVNPVRPESLAALSFRLRHHDNRVAITNAPLYQLSYSGRDSGGLWRPGAEF